MSEKNTQFDVSGRTALVTGAAKGIGRATALGLAQAGADVILAVRDAQVVGDLPAQIEAMGQKAHIMVMDVTDITKASELIDTQFEQGAPVDILVNNAGGSIVEDALDVTPQNLDKVFDLNVKSSFFLSQSVANNLIKRKLKGNIINVSSQAGLVALPTEVAYCMAKAAVCHMTKCLAIEWGPKGIHVNAVCPTFIETPGTASALSDPAFRADTIERIAALKRLGHPKEVADAIIFLASSASSMVTGHNLVVDGGWTIR